MFAIGLVLIVLQTLAYKGNSASMPSYKDDIAEYLGGLVGFNLFGLVGAILIIISLSKNSKKQI